MVHPLLEQITQRVEARSLHTRAAYEAQMQAAAEKGVARARLACGNLAHGFAACNPGDKAGLRGQQKPNVGIVTAYNDMLSAHQPFERFPALIREAAAAAGGVAQVAGSVPAMCDGVTQGQAGMELSLFSRDTIAMSTAIALSHAMFDAILCLGVCDKIVPGLFIGALRFGHLPVVFAPAGPMPSGVPNKKKQEVRQRYAKGEATRDELLEIEAGSYHSPGTCTFYGTANSNQIMMEMMGLHLPGSSFVNPNTPLRDALTRAATRQALANSQQGAHYRPLWRIVTVRTLINGVIGLLATGGSTNHTIHLLAMARAAGIQLTWEDMSELSTIIPLLCRIYPNGEADVNHFHAAGGTPFLIGQLLDAGLLWEEVETMVGTGLNHYRQEPFLEGEDVIFRPGAQESKDLSVLADLAAPFQPEGGITLLTGNLGRAIFKTSAVKPTLWEIEASARVFTTQEAVIAAFRAGELARDVVVVLKEQGPRANGMPELHALMPALGSLIDAGHKVALVTDGRLSGASGKVPAAIHVAPEASIGGPLAQVQDGDIIRLSAHEGVLEVKADMSLRSPAEYTPEPWQGVGRELFHGVRSIVTQADKGASFVVGAEDV